jgi:DNA adenine methylase
MVIYNRNSSDARPFLKWAGGKTQLINEIDKRLPTDMSDINKYIEPFIGGGSIFFYLSNNYDFDESYICDNNNDLIMAYKTIQTSPNKLIKQLELIEKEYLSKSDIDRSLFYYNMRKSFNEIKINYNKDIYRTAQLIFLNHTCFNGLFRVNQNGEFNVPYGNYNKPKICDMINLVSISKLLFNTKILFGDFIQCKQYIDNHTLVYLDPPYRPLNKTSFTSYSKEGFLDKDQLRVAEFFKFADKQGAKVILSNSDPWNENVTDMFFDDLFSEYHIERVPARRMINCNGKNRGNINELIITNY